MNTLENNKNFFDKENSTDSKITNEEIGKRKILKAIFGKEFVSDEELWDAGFGLYGDSIEVENKNISQYGQYKENFLKKKILSRIEFARTSWVVLPDSQKDQIKEVMKSILYGAASLEKCVTVNNITGATIQFLQNLGYGTHGDYQSCWIDLEYAGNAKGDTKYLTAKTALNLSDCINTYILVNFLKKEKRVGKDYTIVPIASIPKYGGWYKDTENINNTWSILDNLNLDFDLETLVSAHGHNSLAFIYLKNVNISKQMQKKQLETVQKKLPIKK